jgi:PAP2 superfamily
VRAIRYIAWGVVVAGAATPLLRRRVRIPPPLVLGAAAAAPVALCVAVPRSRRRDVATIGLQMWAYLAAYELPHDDPERQAARVRVRYPIVADTVLGLGRPLSVRLQRRFSDPARFSALEKVLVWAHWVWFFVPHGAVAYVFVFHRDRLERTAILTYAVFDVGAIFYWLVPTAPPWYAAERGLLDDGRTPRVRRMMIEYGRQFWKDRWSALYDALAGNPLAAMPSLHFATSVNAAHLLSEVGPVEGAVGWTYAVTLGLALVYLGEHYVVDLLAGLALTETIRRSEPAVAPMLGRFSRGLQALEARASS